MTALRRYSLWQEVNIWWVVQGELAHDLLVYYVLCSLGGFMQGWYIGSLIVGK